MSIWADASGKLIRDIGNEVLRHRASVANGWDDGPRKEQLLRIMNRQAPVEELAESLGLLAEAIHAHWKVKPVILIDEYDQTISSASTLAADPSVRRLKHPVAGRLIPGCGPVVLGFESKEILIKNYVKERCPSWAIRFSRRNLKRDGGFVNIPLCLAERFAVCLV